MKYFTFDELFASRTAAEQGIKNMPKTQKEMNQVKENLERLVVNVLDPLREEVGMPVYVTSGYRCPELNRVIKGAKKSQHLKGEAADISCNTYARNKLLALALLRGDYYFDQLILERVDKDHTHWGWLHVSYRAERQRDEVLECYKGVYRKIEDAEQTRLIDMLCLQTLKTE